MANLCRTLTALDVSGNPQLTDEAVHDFSASNVRHLTLSACPNITDGKRAALAERTLCLQLSLGRILTFSVPSKQRACVLGGVQIFDDPEFCSELVEAEVAAEVYSKLELLAMADGYASVAEFVRVYMQAFLDQHQQRRSAPPGSINAPPSGPVFGAPTPVSPTARPVVQPKLPTHHLQ